MKNIIALSLLTSLVVLTASCGKEQSTDSAEPVQEAVRAPVAETAQPSLETVKASLEEAIQSYEEFAKAHRTFVWRDTELRIALAREALEKGEIDLALQEIQVINKEVQLMKEQVAFAKKNWRKFMVNP